MGSTFSFSWPGGGGLATFTFATANQTWRRLIAVCLRHKETSEFHK